jgi:hypothetical protein
MNTDNEDMRRLAIDRLINRAKTPRAKAEATLRDHPKILAALLCALYRNASIRFIPLTRGQVAIVDVDRYEWAMRWLWHAHYNGFAYYANRVGRSGEPKSVFLHRQIAGEPEGEADHINGNTLDCRAQNLRACTRQQNRLNRGPCSSNTSGFVGVTRFGSKWRVEIGVNGKNLYLGRFDNKEDAIAARVYAELTYFGEFAYAARDLLILPLNLFGPPQ